MILLIFTLSGQVAAHGANSYAIIVRNESVMPETADLLVNDTLVLYNTAAWNRSAGIDVDGDGVFDHTCEMGARNTTSNEDECQFTFDANNSWIPGTYTVSIRQNGSEWREVTVELLPDNHTEASPAGPYILLPTFDPNAENMVMIEGNGSSFSRSSVRIAPGGNLYIYSSGEEDYTILRDNSVQICQIYASGASGCKIWFSSQDWSEGQHTISIAGPDGAGPATLLVRIQEGADANTGTGMVQMIASLGVLTCLVLYTYYRTKRN